MKSEKYLKLVRTIKRLHDEGLRYAEIDDLLRLDKRGWCARRIMSSRRAKLALLVDSYAG